MTVTSTPTTMPLELPIAALADQKMGRSPMPKMNASPQSPTASSPQSSMKEKNAAKLRDNAVTMQLTKTKMCAFFERGKCASTNCRYAHSALELRQPPNLQKTKLCRAFLSHGCNDENCFYAHGESDLRVTEGIYKTQICNFFERGYCKKGERCNHAHGTHDMRAQAASSASTPMGKTTPSSQGESPSYGMMANHRPRRSPLPLSELLVADAEANINTSPTYSTPTYSTIPPTPTKSITELAQLSFSPVHSPPMWGQYGMMSPSPMGAYGGMGDLPMWAPRDAVDMLVQDQHLHSPTHLHFEMLEQVHATPLHLPQLTPEKLQLLSVEPSPPPHWAPLDPSLHHRPAPGLLEPARSSPAEPVHSTPPGLVEPAQPSTGEKSRDPLMVNLSERLASLDAVVLGLGSDIAQIKADPNKRLHRI